MKLSLKTSGLVVLSALIPAGIVLGYTLWTIESSRHQATLDRVLSQVELSAEFLSTKFIKAQQQVEIFAQHDQLKSMEHKQFLPLLKRELSRHDGRYEKFIVGTPEGHFYNTSGGNPSAGMLRTFDDLSPGAQPKSIRKRDYWQATVGDNRAAQSVTYVSSPMVSYTTGARQVVVASSVIDDGKVKGMLGISLDWQRVVALIQEIRVSGFSEFDWEPKLFLTARDGTYWYHWDPLKVISLARDKTGRLLRNEDGQTITASYSLSDEGIPELEVAKAKVISGESGVLPYDDLYGQPHYLFYAPVKAAGYSLGLIVTKDQLAAPILDYLKVLGVFLLGVTIVLLVGYVWNRKHIDEPLGRLMGYIGRLRDGHYDEPMPLKREDELAQIGHVLSDMADAITKREKALRASEDRFECAMAGTNDGLWDWNLYTDEVYFSQRWEEMLGYDEGELEGTLDSFMNLIHPDDLEPVNRYVKEFLGGVHDRYHLVLRMIHKNGSVVHILSRAFLVRDKETGRPERLIGTHVDITEQKQFEQEISELNAQLELRVKERTRALEKANHKLETLSLQDGLTELGNRRAMEEDLNRAHAVLHRELRNYSVLLLDIDYFKAYNDHYGHPAGDKVLRQVADLLKDTVRKNDRIYRYGGEEFLILLPDTESVMAKNIAERAVDLVRDIHIEHTESPLGYLSVSIGVATSILTDDTWAAGVKRADESLYQAKASGRNQVVLNDYSLVK